MMEPYSVNEAAEITGQIHSASIATYKGTYHALAYEKSLRFTEAMEEERKQNMAEHDVENRGSKNRGNNSYYSSSAYYEDKENMERGWTSWLIPLFVVANVAVFVVSMYINNCPKNNDFSERKCFARFLRRFSFQPLKENPLLGPSASTLDKMGGLVWLKVHRDEGWRLVTSMWLHAGVIHLAANMVCLVFIGIRLEQQFGFVRIGIIYLLSGFGGSILSTLFLRNNNVSVGASGALFGLLGAMLSELITNWTIYTNKVAALLTLVFIIAINLAVGILPHVDNFAHIGGFLTGFFLGFMLLLRPQFGWTERLNVPADVRVKSKHAAYQYILWLLSLALLIAGFAVGLVALFARVNGNDHCSWCHYLSCVPTSKWKCQN